MIEIKIIVTPETLIAIIETATETETVAGTEMEGASMTVIAITMTATAATVIEATATMIEIGTAIVIVTVNGTEILATAERDPVNWSSVLRDQLFHEAPPRLYMEEEEEAAHNNK
jgi:hypothetical protein